MRIEGVTERKIATQLYKDWLGAFEAIGTPVVSHDTAARILAVLCVHGNNEAMVMNKKFLAEVEHIQKMYHVEGGETPDAELAKLIRQYVSELEQYRDIHANANSSHAPEWAHKLFKERFGIKLLN